MDIQETALVDPLTDPRVFAAVQEYQAALGAGDRPDLTAFLARHPDIAGPLAGCLRGLEFLCAAAPHVARPVSTRTPAPAAPDAHLGDFRIVREVGRGGMGVVYEAEQLSLGRRVALKVVSLPPAADRARRRFHHEAHAAAVLSHPHIVPVYAVGSDGDKLFLAMRFVEGRSLAAVLVRLRTPTAPTDDTTAPVAGCDTAPLSGPPTAAHYRAAARLAAVAADALQHAHDLGIVHRDVKPGNLLLEPNGHLWVADFGLARLPGADDLTRTGEVLGTLRYMSPEQATGAAVDHRADVYSLGATLYELLTLRPAFPGSDPHEVLRRITGADPTPPRALAPTLPADLETIALKALAKEPAERYPTARAFADDLDRFLTDRPITARPPTLARRVSKWVKRNLKPLSVVAGGGFVTLLAVTVALAVSGEQVRIEQRLTAGLNSELTQTAGQLNQANADLTTALGQARRAEYTYRFLAARREWLDGNPGRAEELLDSCPQEHRRWEWGYLKNLCRPGLQVLNAEEASAAARIVFGLRFHPAGTSLILGYGGEYFAWVGLGEGRAPRRFSIPHEGGSMPAAFDPDGKRIYTVTTEQLNRYRLIFTDAISGKQIRNPELARLPREFSPDGRHFLCFEDGRLVQIGLPDVNKVSGFKYSDPPGDISRVKYAPSGRWLVILGKSGRVKLASAQTGEVEIELPTPESSAQPIVAVSPNDSLLAVTSGQQAIVIWDLVTRREIQTLRGHTAAIMDLSFAPDGRRLASVGADRVVRVWDAVAGKEVHAYRGHDADLGGVAFDPTGVRIATADRSGRVVIWDAAAAQEGTPLPDPSGFSLGAVLDAQLPRLFRPCILRSGAAELAVQSIDLPAGTTTQRSIPVGTKGCVVIPVTNGDGMYLKSKYPEWLLCDPTGERLARLTEGPHGIGAAVLNPDQKWLALSRYDTPTIYLFDAMTGECRHQLNGRRWASQFGSGVPYPGNLVAGHRIAINGLAFHPTESQLLSAGAGGTVHIWDTRSGQCVRTLSDHTNDVGGVTYSPDGRWFATVGWDGKTHLYTAGGDRVRTLQGGESEPLAAVAFTPDGSRLATVGRSGWLRLWDPDSGEEYLSVRNTTSRPASLRSLGFSADGRFLVGVDTQGRPTVWDGDTVTSEQRQARQAARLTDWYQAQAAEAEKAKDWFAAVWYRQQLATREPENTEYKAQFEKAKTSLAAERTGK